MFVAVALGGIVVTIYARLDDWKRGSVNGALLGATAASLCMRLALRNSAIALATTLFFLSIRRAGERVGRLSERLEITEKSNEVQRRMLVAVGRRPRGRDDLVARLPVRAAVVEMLSDLR